MRDGKGLDKMVARLPILQHFRSEAKSIECILIVGITGRRTIYILFRSLIDMMVHVPLTSAAPILEINDCNCNETFHPLPGVILSFFNVKSFPGLLERETHFA
jgi:hypothetical protein